MIANRFPGTNRIICCEQHTTVDERMRERDERLLFLENKLVVFQPEHAS